MPSSFFFRYSLFGEVPIQLVVYEGIYLIFFNGAPYDLYRDIIEDHIFHIIVYIKKSPPRIQPIFFFSNILSYTTHGFFNL